MPIVDKFCPFLNTRDTIDKDMIMCRENCALYWKGFCSIHVLAQKATHDVKTADTPTAKARWVLMYIHFQIYSKAYKTDEFP